MFGLKKHPNEPQKISDQPTHDIGVIPDIFYGGNDPEIYNEKEVGKKETLSPKKVSPPGVEKTQPTPTHLPPRRTLPPPLPPAQSVSAPTTPPPPSGLTQPVPSSGGSKKFLIVALIILVLMAGGTAAWFFFLQPPKEVAIQEVPPEEKPIENPLPDVLPPVETVTTSTVTSTEVQTPVFSTSTVSRERSLPQFSLISPVDTDNDKLSAEEEAIFETDPEVFDTDSDGYFDGQEVFNLYNPKGIAPMKIIDSGLVQEYVNPTFQYRLYYPSSWIATAIDERDNKDVLLSNITGDYIQVKAYDKTIGETFPGWFGRVVGDQIYSDLVSSTNRFSVPFYRRKDGLVSYFDTPNQVYIVILYSRDEDKNNWPHVMDMAVQSFRTGRVSADLPVQIVVPTAEGTSTTPLSSPPVSPLGGTPSSSVR